MDYDHISDMAAMRDQEGRIDVPDVSTDLHEHQYLPNGALLLLERELPDREGKEPASIVLGKTRKDWVTWLRVKPAGTKEDFCVSGHYFRIAMPLSVSLREAIEDFDRREGAIDRRQG